MHILSSILLFAAISTGLAHDLAVRVPQPGLSLRIPVAAGGWALSTDGSSATNLTCPADAPPCGATWCCPSSLNCVHTGGSADAEVCCGSEYPDSAEDQCIQDFGHLYNTSCADSSWVLWNATTGDYPIDFFCCLPGTTGTQSGLCLSAAELETTGDLPGVRISGTSLISSTAASSTTGSTKSSPATNTPTGTRSAGTGSGGSSTSPGANSPTGTSTSSGSSSTPTKNLGADFKAYGPAVFAQVLAAGFAVALL